MSRLLLLTIPALLIACDRGAPLHASQLEPTPTATEGIAERLIDSFWQAPLVEDEDWIQADTTAWLHVEDVQGSQLSALVWHAGGTPHPEIRRGSGR